MAKAKAKAKDTTTRIEDHDLLRVLDTLDRNGPLTFREICESAEVNHLKFNADLYTADDLGPPFNMERSMGQLHRISRIGRMLIRIVRGDPGKPLRTLPARTTPTAAIGDTYVMVTGDPNGFRCESDGSLCTVKSHKDGMVWYTYADQKLRWGRCSRSFCMSQEDFDATFAPYDPGGNRSCTD